MANEPYKFPDEIEGEGEQVVDIKAEAPEIEIEVIDDTPIQDRGRVPLNREVEDPTDDEIESYSEGVKKRIKELTHARHDERRSKEAVLREKQELERLAQHLIEENKSLKKSVNVGQEAFISSSKEKAEADLAMARRQYKEAQEAFDTDAIIAAQEALTEAKWNLEKVKNYRVTPLQEQEIPVQMEQERVPQVPQPDRRAMAWQERNPWFGQDEEMTAAALGLHEKLKRNGMVVGSDDYYATLDKTMRKRFSENFESSETETKVETPRTKPSTVVAPAMRSTSSKKVKLKQSQMDTIKKLGITPEQYVREFVKLEAANG